MKEIDQPSKEKSKGFWKRLWDHVEPNEKVLNPRRFWIRNWDEERKRLSDDISCGLVPSDQNFKEHKGLV